MKCFCSADEKRCSFKGSHALVCHIRGPSSPQHFSYNRATFVFLTTGEQILKRKKLSRDANYW